MCASCFVETREHLSQIPSVLAMMSSSTSSDKVNGSPSPAKQKKKPAEAAATPQASVNKSTSHSHKLFATLQELVQSSAAAGDAQVNCTVPSSAVQLEYDNVMSSTHTAFPRL